MRVYVWRCLAGWCVYVWHVACALDFVVFVAIARCNENMFSCSQGLTIQHSLFVVANSCCHHHCRCTMRYKKAGHLHPRPCRWHSSSSLPLLLSSLPLRDAIWKCWALAPEASTTVIPPKVALSSAFIIIIAIVVVVAVVRRHVYALGACLEDLVIDICCCRCSNW